MVSPACIAGAMADITKTLRESLAGILSAVFASPCDTNALER